MGADKFDNLSADMFDEFDIDMDDGGSNKKDKGSETLKNVSELLKSTSAGALRGVRNELKSRFGNTSEVVEDTIATVDDFKKLQQDLAGEISPAVNTMKQITLRSMPMIEKIMPKKWYDSIKKKLEESIIPTERRRDMEAEARNETIRSSIQSIFEGQTEIQKQMIVKQDTERMVDRKLSEEHFKASYESLSKIGDSVTTVAEFLTGTYTSYLKKSLELKYQGIFVLRDIHKATVAIAKIAEDRLKEISKNTGLPEYMKTGNLKSGGLAASRGSRLQTFSEYQSSFRSTFMQNISKSVMGGVKNVTRGLIPQLDMMTSMMEMMGGGEKLTPMKLVAMALGLGAQYGAKKLFGDKLKKYDGLRDLIENKGKFFKTKGISWLQQFAERHRGEYGTLAGWIADKIPSFNKQAMRNSMLEGANEAVPFDNTTRQTIVEVMPRHLERIGNLVEALQQTLAPNAKINQMTFNVHQRKLTTIEEAREDFIEKEFGSKEDRARRMDESMGKMRGVLLANNNAKMGTAKAEKLQNQMTKMGDYLKRFLLNSATAIRFFDYEAILNYYSVLSSGKQNSAGAPYIKLVFDGIPEDVETRKAFVELLLDMTKDPNTKRPNGMMIDRINATISDRMNDTNIQEMMAKASEGFGQSQLFSDIATHKEGVKNAGLLNVLDPKLKKKKTTFYNPKTGEAYSSQELKQMGLDGETQSDEDRSMESEVEDLRHLKLEEERLRRQWKHRGGKEGDVADQLSDVLGGAAYALPDFINHGLTKGVDWLKGKYQKTKQKMSDFFSDDTVIGEVYNKAKDKYDENTQKRPHVTSVVKTGPTTYVLSASDQRFNRYSETINITTPLKAGSLPIEEINKLCNKKNWVFNISDPNFRYSEITDDSDIPEHYEEVTPASTYTVSSDTSSSYTVGGPTKKEHAPAGRETVRTAADVAEEAVAFDSDSRTALRRWIPDKLDKIIELLGGGKPHGVEIPPDVYNPTDPVVWDTKPSFTRDGSRRIGLDPQNSIGSTTTETEIHVGRVTSNVKGGSTEEHRPMGFSAIMEERSSESPKATVDAIKGTAKAVKQKVKDVTGKLVETFQCRDDLVKYFPESMQEQVGALYDNAVKSGHSIGKFFNKLGRDLKVTGAQKKILDDLKRISTVIPSVDQRKKYLGEILSQVVAYKNTIADSKKRKEALNNLRNKMVSGLEDIQKEIQEKGVGGTIKSKATSGLKGLWRKLRFGWLKFRRSKIGRWIMAHIPDSAKKDVKEAFEKAKGDVKKGIEDAKKVIKKYNKEAEPGEQKIDPTMMNASKLEESDDQEKPTNKKSDKEKDAESIVKEAIPEPTLQHADDEIGQATPVEEKQPGFFGKIGSLFHKDKPKTNVENTNNVGFFGKVKNLFHKDKPEVVKEEVKETSTSSTTSTATQQTPPTDAVQATKKESSDAKAPEGELAFEGAAESLFHSDFRLFAQRQIADNQSLLAAIMGIPGGGKGKGIFGSIITAGGKLGGGLLGAYGRIMGAMMSGDGRIIGGALKAAPAVDKALWTTKKTVGRLWEGSKRLTGKAWKGITYSFRKKPAKPLEEPSPVPADKKYYQDANGKWHGPDGKFISVDKVPEQYKTAQDTNDKPSLLSRIKNKVTGWLSKPGEHSKKKDGKDDDDNIWNRKGWGGFFRTAWDGAKKVGSGIAKLFSKEKESESEVPKAGRKLGIDLLLNKITDIYNLLKEETDRRVEKDKKEEEAKAKEEEAKKDAEQAEANMSADEQKAANEKRLGERKKEMAEDAAARAAAQSGKGNEGTTQGQGSGEGQGGNGDGGMLSDMISDTTDWIGDKALKGSRRLSGKTLKLLRKTKLGRKFLRSGTGKLMRKGIGTFLQKGKIGFMGRVGNTARGTARVAGRGLAAAAKGAASLAGKGIGMLGSAAGATAAGGASAVGTGATALASKAGMLGKLGSVGAGMAGKLGGLGGLIGGAAKFAGPIGLAITAAKGIYDGYKGWSNAGEALGVDQSKLNFAEKASGALGGIASGLSFGLLDRGKATRGINWLSRKIGFSTDLDPEEREDLEYRAANGDEEAKKKLAEAKGGLFKAAKNVFKYASPIGWAASGLTKAGNWLGNKLGLGGKKDATGLERLNNGLLKYATPVGLAGKAGSWLANKLGFGDKKDGDKEGIVKKTLKYATPAGLGVVAGGWLSNKLGFGSKKDTTKDGDVKKDVTEEKNVKKPEEKDSKQNDVKLDIPQDVAQSIKNATGTVDEFRSEFGRYVDDHYPDASESSRKQLIESTVASMWGNQDGSTSSDKSPDGTRSTDESKSVGKKTDETSTDKNTTAKPDDAKAALDGIPKQTKSGWGGKFLKAAALVSPVGMAAMATKKLNDKFDLTGKVSKGLKIAGMDPIHNLKNAWGVAKWLGSKHISAYKAVGKALFGGGSEEPKEDVPDDTPDDLSDEQKLERRLAVAKRTMSKQRYKQYAAKQRKLFEQKQQMKKAGVTTGTFVGDELVTDKATNEDIPQKSSDQEKPTLGVPKKASWGSKISSLAMATSPVGLAMLAARKLNNKYDLSGKLTKLSSYTPIGKGIALAKKYDVLDKVNNLLPTSGLISKGISVLRKNDKSSTENQVVPEQPFLDKITGTKPEVETVDAAAGSTPMSEDEQKLERRLAVAKRTMSKQRYKQYAAKQRKLFEQKQKLKASGAKLVSTEAQQSDTTKQYQTMYANVVGTKPKSEITTSSGISDKQMTEHDGVKRYLEDKHAVVNGTSTSQKSTTENDALLQATTVGNGDIVSKLTELVQLMKEQIVVTSDSKVAQEKATSEGAQKALTAAMAYARETAQNAIAASRPKPRRAPAIDVSKPVPA